jgi:hypothetical protein
MKSEIVEYKNQRGNSISGPKRARRKLLSGVRVRTELTEEEREILDAAQQARDEWLEASANFDYVHEEMLVDYCTYKLKACESRYAYFVRLAKEKGLSRYI